MTITYNLPNIRTLLTEGFTNEELRRFCYDLPEFKPVYNELSQQMGKAQTIDLILEYAEQKLKLEALLAWADQSNPARYKQHQPYKNVTPYIPPYEITDLPQHISVVQQFPAPGWGTTGITFDGAHLWLSDSSGTIFKIDSSGKILGNFAAPEVTPQGITWVDPSFWVYTTNKSFIYQFQIAGQDTITISSFPSPTRVVGGDLAWGDQGLWYGNQFNVYKLDTSCKILHSFSVPYNIVALTWASSYLWLAHNEFPSNATLTMVNTAGESLGMLPSPIFEITGLAWAKNGVLWASGRDAIGGKPIIYQLEIR